MKHIMTFFLLVINVLVLIQSIIVGNYFIALVCAFFGTMCFIELKEGI